MNLVSEAVVVTISCVDGHEIELLAKRRGETAPGVVVKSTTRKRSGREVISPHEGPKKLATAVLHACVQDPIPTHFQISPTKIDVSL